MASETLILADLHLRAQAPDVARRLLRLESRLIAADAVYILGDLFEAWIGDDAPVTDDLAPALHALARIAAAGVPLYFQHGNRDFLIGKRFAKQLGIRLLPEEVIIDLYGHRVALVHGDQLCTDDLAYQRLRRRLRHPVMRFILSHLPLSARQRLASNLRERSKKETGHKAAGIMDVSEQAVAQLMDRLETSVLIHGHTHRPAFHHEIHGLRAVLGDWEDAAMILSIRPAGLRLEKIDDQGATTTLAESAWP